MSGEVNSQKKLFGDLLQIGVVVRDLDRTVKMLSEIFGLGPFRIITQPPADRTDIQFTYHGKPGNFTFRMAAADLGPVELEIIQPLTGENVYSDFLEEHGEGIHHIKFSVPEVEPVIESLTEHGIKVTQSGSGLRPGTTWVYLGTESKIGFIIEIMNVLQGTDGRVPQIVDGNLQL